MTTLRIKIKPDTNTQILDIISNFKLNNRLSSTEFTSALTLIRSNQSNLNDLRLLFSTAMANNKPNSLLYNDAYSLNTLFESLVSPLGPLIIAILNNTPSNVSSLVPFSPLFYKDALENTDWTPLHLASYMGRVDIIPILINTDSLEARDSIYGGTPLVFLFNQGLGLLQFTIRFL